MSKVRLDGLEPRTPEEALMDAQEALALDVAVEIERAMKVQGWTQTELAKRLYVPEMWLDELLQGDSTVTLRYLVRVASALGCKVEIRFVKDKP